MLKIPDSGALDFLAVGALVHRLDPGVIPFPHASQLAIHVSGGEYNCAANLASCFGMRTAIAAAMVSYPIGDMIDCSVRALGVRPFYKRFAHDGVRGPNMATVYSDARCRGARAGGVLQSRERGGRPPAARRLRLARHHAGWGPLAALGWHLRGALGDDPAGDHRGDAGREGGWRSGLLRPELPPQALAGRRRRG